MKYFGYLLIVVGFLWGAYLTVEQPEGVNTGKYLVALAIGVTGVITARTAVRAEARDVTRLKTNIATIEASLAAIASDAERLDEQKESINVYDIRHVIDENRSVLEFLSADYTFADDRLAAFYGLNPAEHQPLPLADTPRRGLLTHASILTLTSHPTRTSPVNRGVFVLDKLLGTPPPPAPGNVPALEETKVDSAASLRDQLEAHRENKQCAACHAYLDPIGLGLENFDAIGRWRDHDEGRPIDASGKLVTGERFENLADLQQLLLESKQDEFVENLTRQLLTYALARGLEVQDKLAVREIIRRTAEDEFRFQTMIREICDSVPFQRMRDTQD